MKISEVIEQIKSHHPPHDNPHTNDTIKYGDPDRECTGVAVTCFVSAEVIRQANSLGANLIICHEPVFWNHVDQTGHLKDDPVFQAKKALLDEGGITIWRDHDHIHGGRPMKEGKPYMDGIFHGIMEEMGWTDYLVKWPNMPLVFRIPETTARGLAQEFMEKINLRGVRVVGDPDAPVKTVYLCEHVNGGRRDDPMQDEDNELIRFTDSDEIDALVPLEIIDWTLSAYVRDSAQLGRPRAILEMGHFNVEELGMRYMVRWLPDLLGNEIPVHYIQSGDAFSYVTRDQK